MTAVTPGATVRDSQILELLRGNTGIDRIVAIGKHRGTWTAKNVADVITDHYTPNRRKLRAVQPPTHRRIAECGTPSGYRRHRRLHEPVCDPCRTANNVASRRPAREKPPLTPWTPPAFTGHVTDVELSPARIDVLEELCRGLSNARIGRRLGIAEDTVKSHVRDILAATGAVDRTHVVVMVLTGQVRILGAPREGRAA